MEQQPDPRVTGSFPSASRNWTGKIPQTPGSDPSDLTGRLILTPTSARMPVVIPADKKKQPLTRPMAAQPSTHAHAKKPNKFRKLDRRFTWYVVSAVGILTIVLGFVLTVPLNNGQQGSSTVAQSITNLITNGQSGNVSSQSQSQSQGGSSQTPGYSNSAAGGSRLFSNSSPWNVPIGNNVQLDPNSSSMANELSGGNHVPAMFSFGMPIYTSTASDPSYTVQDDGGDGTFQSRQPIHIPSDAAPSTGSDHWLFIYDKTKSLLFEMWDTQKSGDTWTTQTGDVYSPTGDGVLQIDGSQQSGNGASYFGGVITDADIQRGYINHALSFASQYTGSDHRYPMTASDGHDGDIPMGARIQLNPSVNCGALPGASSGEKMVCQALETYGGYMRDTGGVVLSMYFEGEDLNDPSRNPPDGSAGNAGRSGGVFGRVGLHDGADLGEIPWGKLRVLKSWNSFTALGTSTTPAPLAYPLTPGTLQPLLTPGYAALGIPAIRPTLIADTTHTRRWLKNNRRPVSAQTALSTTDLLPLPNRFLLLRRFPY
jgi:hypothetical protein